VATHAAKPSLLGYVTIWINISFASSAPSYRLDVMALVCNFVSPVGQLFHLTVSFIWKKAVDKTTGHIQLRIV
jgi:hypothetical protein